MGEEDKTIRLYKNRLCWVDC